MNAVATATASDLGDLQRRVFDAVARTVDRPTGPTAWEPGAVTVLATGLSDLIAASRPASLPVPRPAAAGDPAAVLASAGDALDDLAEAARRVGVAFSGAGHESAADTADAVMTVALALRMLVEVGRCPRR